MSREHTLESPFMTLTFNGRPDHWRILFAAWMVLWSGVTIGLIYAYAVVFPNLVGFETALLVGIALISLGVSQ